MPAKLPFYYGWLIAIGGGVNASFVLGSAQFALQTFLVPMEEDLGWSRTVFFGALSLRYLLAGLLGPLFGPWADSIRGPRFIMPLGVLLLSGSQAAIRWVDHPLLFVAIYGVIGAFAAAMIQLVMWEAVMLKWFSRKRTRALVIGGIGEGSGPLFFPLLVTVFIAWFGWRDAWLWYGVVTFAVLMPFALAVRTRPEQVGQEVDGNPAPVLNADEPRQPSHAPDDSFARAEALRTRSFWLLLGTFTMSGIVITGFQSQWIPHFRDIGISATLAAGAVSVYGLFNIVSRVLWGVLVPRVPIRTLMIAHSIAAGAGVAFLVFVVSEPVTLYIWAVYQGLMLGVFFSLHTMICADFFGRSHIGAIRGTMLLPSSLSRAGGPLILNALRGWGGGYFVAFVSVLVGWGLMAVMTFLARKPVRVGERER